MPYITPFENAAEDVFMVPVYGFGFQSQIVSLETTFQAFLSQSLCADDGRDGIKVAPQPDRTHAYKPHGGLFHGFTHL